jgi:hypothetical protein
VHANACPMLMRVFNSLDRSLRLCAVSQCLNRWTAERSAQRSNHSLLISERERERERASFTVCTEHAGSLDHTLTVCHHQHTSCVLGGCCQCRSTTQQARPCAPIHSHAPFANVHAPTHAPMQGGVEAVQLHGVSGHGWRWVGHSIHVHHSASCR